MPRKKRSQQQRSSEMIDTIHEATARVLVKRGYPGTTTNHIAETAGISIGSFYRYYKNKEAVVVALLEAQTKIAENLLLEGLSDSQHLNPEELAKKLVETIFNFYCDHEALWSIFYKQLPHERQFRGLTDHFDRCGQLIEAFLSTREDEVQFKDRKLASSIIVHSLVGIFFGTDPQLRKNEKRKSFLKEIQALIVLYAFAKR